MNPMESSREKTETNVRNRNRNRNKNYIPTHKDREIYILLLNQPTTNGEWKLDTENVMKLASFVGQQKNYYAMTHLYKARGMTQCSKESNGSQKIKWHSVLSKIHELKLLNQGPKST